jgi:hypothetical protein
MRTFKDNAGRTWTIAVTVGSVKRVKSLLGINLYECAGGSLLDRLANDIEMLVDVIYVLCKPEADKANVTDEQFGEALAGDAIDHATTAFKEELVSFFPSGQREVMRAALAKADAVQKRAMTLALEKIDSMDPEQLIRDSLNENPGESPDDSEESTPKDSPSES